MDKREELERRIEVLKKQLDNIPEKIELRKGVWYKEESTNFMICIQIPKYNINSAGYGFCKSGEWSDSVGTHSIVFVLASNNDVKNALSKEAEKRGFKTGVSFKLIKGDIGGINNAEITNDYKFEYNPLLNTLEFYKSDNFYTIFENGIWAEIVKEESVIINNHSMKIEADYVVFGCAKFHINRFIELCNVLNNWESLKDEGKNNRSIVSFRLSSGVEITFEELKKIINHININKK